MSNGEWSGKKVKSGNGGKPEVSVIAKCRVFWERGAAMKNQYIWQGYYYYLARVNYYYEISLQDAREIGIGAMDGWTGEYEVEVEGYRL